jgi:hypothetical protein
VIAPATPDIVAKSIISSMPLGVECVGLIFARISIKAGLAVAPKDQFNFIVSPPRIIRRVRRRGAQRRSVINRKSMMRDQRFICTTLGLVFPATFKLNKNHAFLPSASLVPIFNISKS